MIKRRILVTFFSISFLISPIFATHTVNRYFPFLDKTEDYITQKRSYTSPALFMTTARTAFHREEGNTVTIPSLLGDYDLKDVIESVQLARQNSSYNPFDDEPGYVDWNEKEIKFKVDGKVKSRGVILAHEQNIFKLPFSVGFFLPIMHVNTSQRFAFHADGSDAVVQNLNAGELELIDRVRREVHDEIGLYGDDWSGTGIGDLDVHLRYQKEFDHKLKMRTITLAMQPGILFPISSRADFNYPSSVPFMGNKHWGVYLDVVSEFELKQNWKTGLMFGFVELFRKTHNMRVPAHKESPAFSALVGDIEINPGFTFKFSPYFTLENISDGLSLQLRYDYVRHGNDIWKDVRVDKSVNTYLDRDQETKDEKYTLTKWVMHYLTMQLRYDSQEAMKNWWFKPNLYATYNYPFKGRGSAKTHQFMFGIELNW